MWTGIIIVIFLWIRLSSENVILAELSNYNISTWIPARKFELCTNKHVRTVPFLKPSPKSVNSRRWCSVTPGPPKLKKHEEKSFFKHFEDEKFECFNLKGMHFIHLNARSFLPKMAEMRIIASISKTSLIAISKTWIDNSVTDSEISIEGYHILRKDRNRSGGGVCVYVRSNLAFARRTDIDSDNLESLWLELYLSKTKPIIVGVCYRPPTQISFIDHWEEDLCKIRSDCETIILGDFNIYILVIIFWHFVLEKSPGSI